MIVALRDWCRRRSTGRSTACAFTLVEILAVVIILGIMAAVVVPRVLATTSSAKRSACNQNKNAINKSVEHMVFR